MFLIVHFGSPTYNEPPLYELSEEYTEKVAKADKIDLNNATSEELTALFGVGEARARNIIAYREKHGGFVREDELMCVPYMPKSVYHKNKDLITVGAYEYEVQPS
jgi:competence protein ComEA